jgi:hypothetical protein
MGLLCHRELSTTVINLLEVSRYLFGATIDKLGAYLAWRHPILIVFTYSDHIALIR